MRNDEELQEELQDAEFDDLDEANESTPPSPADLLALRTTPDHLKPGYAKPFRPAACHPDKREYKTDSGLCRTCYDSIRHTGERGRARAVAHIESNSSLSSEMRADVIEHIGKISAYVRKPEKDRKHVDTRKKSVSKHAATAVIVNAMDFVKAAEALKPDMSPYEQHKLAHQLEHDANVQTEVQTLLKKRGLDDESREYFVQKLWQLFESNDPRQEQKALGAMRILGRAFISEKIENTQVEMLKINGISEGLERMLGEADSEAQAGVSPFDEVRTQLNLKDEKFDE
jgi:hypothetical protein